MFQTWWNNNPGYALRKVPQARSVMKRGILQPLVEKHRFRLLENGGFVLRDLLQLNPTDNHLADLFIRMMDNLQEITREHPFWETCPPWNHILTNEKSIWAGQMLSGYGLPFPVSRCPCSIGIVGAPGSAKTTMTMLEAIQLIMAGATVVVWDIKDTWRKLANIPFMAGRIVVMQTNHRIWSLFQPPPNTTSQEWANRSTNVFAQSYGRISSPRLMRELLDKLLMVCPLNYWPFPRLIIERLNLLEMKSHLEREYAASIKWALIDMMNHFPSFDYTSSDWFEHIYKQPGKLYVIEDSGLPVQHRNFSIVLQNEWIFTFRRNNPQDRNHPVIHVLEDCTPLLDPGQDTLSPSKMSILAQNMNITREMNIGFITCSHSLDQISPKILPNLESYFVCSLRGQNLQHAKQILGTNDEQTEMLRVNPRGTACALIPSVWPYPVMISFPNFMEMLA